MAGNPYSLPTVFLGAYRTNSRREYEEILDTFSRPSWKNGDIKIIKDQLTQHRDKVKDELDKRQWPLKDLLGFIVACAEEAMHLQNTLETREPFGYLRTPKTFIQVEVVGMLEYLLTSPENLLWTADQTTLDAYNALMQGLGLPHTQYPDLDNLCHTILNISKDHRPLFSGLSETFNFDRPRGPS